MIFDWAAGGRNLYLPSLKRPFPRDMYFTQAGHDALYARRNRCYFPDLTPDESIPPWTYRTLRRHLLLIRKTHGIHEGNVYLLSVRTVLG